MVLVDGTFPVYVDSSRVTARRTNSSLLPEVLTPVIAASSITFTWKAIAEVFHCISVSANDVERYRSFLDHGDLNSVWQRSMKLTPEYFQFAYVKYSHWVGLGLLSIPNQVDDWRMGVGSGRAGGPLRKTNR